MRTMDKDEQALFDIIKGDTSLNNYDVLRVFYEQEYGIKLPPISKELPNLWTTERKIRLLKQTYPSLLTNSEERDAKAEQETNYKDMARVDNRPVREPTLGLFGENEWW